MFELTSTTFRTPEMEMPNAGGFVTFEGKVRNHANGRAVMRLEYEAFPELAITEGDRLIAEAIERFELQAARVIHRVGTLEIGETAVWIGVASAHRREAFAACEWIIDQLKHRVPIWKRETFADGISEWVGIHDHATATSPSLSMFDRQMKLSEIGEAGQRKLKDARVLLVGMGGLGSGSLPYLVGAGIGTIGLVDGDSIDVTNLHRQVIFRANEAGRLKVDRAAAFAQRLNPGLAVETHAEMLDASNVDRLVCSYDWIIDGTDSLEVKFLLNAACRRHGKPLITASVHRFDGHLMTVMPDGPCLQCLFPTVPPDGCVDTCEQVGVVGVVPGLFGMLQANEAIKGIVGYGELLRDELAMIDIRTLSITKLKRSTVPGCPGCAGSSTFGQFEFKTIQGALEALGDVVVVDIREFDEGPAVDESHVRLPVSEFEWGGWDLPVLLVCASGTRSVQLVLELREAGHENVFAIREGLNRLEEKRVESK